MSKVTDTLKDKGIDLETYQKILDDCYSKINRMSDDDWQDIVDRYNLNIHYDSLRKNFSGIFGSGFVIDYMNSEWKKKMEDTSQTQMIDDKIRELERKKIEYRDSRNTWNRQNYNSTRLNETLEILESKLEDIGKVTFPHVAYEPHGDNSERELIICLSDLHIGQTFETHFGFYNSEVAKTRLQKYLSEIKRIGWIHGIRNVRVVCLGDLISGNIHKTVAITNKEDVIEQVKVASSYIAHFCYDLCTEFNEVNLYNVSGNHSRIDRKEDALHDERLDDIIGWIVSACLNHISNFHYRKDCMVDTGIALFPLLGKNYVAVHGDYDTVTSKSIASLSMMLGFIPYSVIMGHRHYPSYSVISNIRVVQCGSLAGTGDQYTVEKRLAGTPSQTVLVCSEKGIECIYNVDL